MLARHNVIRESGTVQLTLNKLSGTLLDMLHRHRIAVGLLILQIPLEEKLCQAE